MKNTKTFFAFAIMLFYLPISMFAEIIVTNQANNQYYSGGLICSGAASDNPKLRASVPFFPAITVGEIANIFLDEYDSGFNFVKSTDLDASMTASSGQTINTGVWNVEFGNNSITTSFVSSGTSFTKTVNFTRKDANYKFRVLYGSSVEEDTSWSFYFIEGTKPWVRITDANEVVSWGTNDRHHEVLKGCTNDDPRVRISPTACGNDHFKLRVVEYDFANSDFIGTPADRTLTASEVSDLLSGEGVPINGFSDGTNSVNLVADKHYHITLVYVGQGTWKASHNIMHYKEGNFDLVMHDNSQDDGFEPTYNGVDIFKSPDLWNKPSNTGSPNTTTHEDPVHATMPGNHNRLMVKVSNIGCVASPENTPLRLFWTRARTDELWSDHWLYDMATNAFPDPNPPFTMRSGGSEITINGATQSNPYNTNSNPYMLPSIVAGGSYTMSYADGVQWFPPDPDHYDATSGSLRNADQKPVVCLLARINEPTSSSDPIRFEPTGTVDKILPYAKENNNVVTRNTVLTNQTGFFVGNPTGGWHHGFSTVVVNNDNPLPNTVDICLDRIPDTYTVGTFLDHGTIEIGVTQDLYEAWVLGGAESTNITVVSPTLFEMTSGNHGCLENIAIPSGSMEQLGVRFQYDGMNLPGATMRYEYVLSQNEGTSEFAEYGSNTIFIADVPTTVPGPMPPPMFAPTTNDQDAALKDSNGDIELLEGVLEIYPNPSTDYITIQIGNEPAIGKLNVYDVNGKLLKTEQLIDASKSTQINIANLPSGNFFIEFTDQNGFSRKGKFIKL